MLDSIKGFRNSIEQLHCTKDFYWLVNRALILCQDGHTDPARKYLYKYIADDDKVKMEIN